MVWSGEDDSTLTDIEENKCLQEYIASFTTVVGKTPKIALMIWLLSVTAMIRLFYIAKMDFADVIKIPNQLNTRQGDYLGGPNLITCTL